GPARYLHSSEELQCGVPPRRRWRGRPGCAIPRRANLGTFACRGVGLREEGGVMVDALRNALVTFNKQQKFSRKGPLCVALVITQHARKMGLPLDPDKLLTEAGGQVLGLGK